MPNFEDTLRNLEAEIKALRERQETAPDRYAEGFRDAHAAITAAVREALATVIRQHLDVAPAPQSTPKPPTPNSEVRLSAPTKDQLVRDHLAAHPGSRYRDVKNALSEYTATRLYALEKRGEVIKDEEGRFHLKSHIGAPNAPPARNRERS